MILTLERAADHGPDLGQLADQRLELCPRGGAAERVASIVGPVGKPLPIANQPQVLCVQRRPVVGRVGELEAMREGHDGEVFAAARGRAVA